MLESSARNCVVGNTNEDGSPVLCTIIYEFKAMLRTA
jgi:hypothetical protein